MWRNGAVFLVVAGAAFIIQHALEARLTWWVSTPMLFLATGLLLGLVASLTPQEGRYFFDAMGIEAARGLFLGLLATATVLAVHRWAGLWVDPYLADLVWPAAFLMGGRSATGGGRR